MTARTLRVGYIGNFGPEHSTENHMATAWEYHGHTVDRMQENTRDTWSLLGDQGAWPTWPEWDLILWTRTGWDWAHYGWDHESAKRAMLGMLGNANSMGVPTVGFHLDRWWGLDRDGQVYEEPFFQCDVVITADGGHDDDWKRAGVNHAWMPPGVSMAECEPGRVNRTLYTPLVFVGSWQGGYHPEWQHRPQLVEHLRSTYGARVAFWPRPGQHAVRGTMLRDLYATADVAVGDSCLVPNADGSPVTRYWSDRVPETTGRGCYLIHPDVDGLSEMHPGVATFPIGDFDALDREIERALGNPRERAAVAAGNAEWTLAWHTYERRVVEIVEMLGL